MRILSLASLGIGCVLLCSCEANAPKNTAAKVSSDVSAPIELKGFLAMGYPEQDVYISPQSANEQFVSRYESATSDNPQHVSTLFKRNISTSKEAHPHDLLKTGKDALGPFERGVSLRIPYMRWTSAHGKGTYAVKNGVATLDAKLEGLQRSATYSLWCATVGKSGTYEWPCIEFGKPGNPLQSTPYGTLDVKASFPALVDSTTQTGSWLMIAYHSDKNAAPGEFGKTLHVQLAYKIPRAEELRPAY